MAPKINMLKLYVHTYTHACMFVIITNQAASRWREPAQQLAGMKGTSFPPVRAPAQPEVDMEHLQYGLQTATATVLPVSWSRATVPALTLEHPPAARTHPAPLAQQKTSGIFN